MLIVYDYIHVATINNATIQSDDLLTEDTLFQLQTLADQHEFNLAYNSSDSIRAIAGATLAAQIVQQLNKTITSKSKSALGVQFGAYASFLAFFGLAQLPAANPDFYGIVDYASAMVFELVTNATVTNTSYPSTSDISVRFLFTNGSAALTGGVTAYPLFGQKETTISWNTFVDGMNNFAIGDQVKWCTACGNSTGVCASSNSSSSSSSTSSDSSSGSGGVSRVVAGVIGAMVTLAVILGLEALIILIAGLRIVSKKAHGAGHNGVESGSPVKA
jgi:hypothetical protein